MAEEAGQRRKLAAILSADVVGYSRLMQDDEAATVATLQEYRAAIGRVVARHGGRIVNAPGDNMLAEFASAVEAVAAAVEIQRNIEGRNAELAERRRMHLRVGVNLGDVIEEPDGTIYGDGVNIAARMEALAEDGGICISSTVYDAVEGKLDYGFDFLGEQPVKNIARPVRVYRVRGEGAGTRAAVPPAPVPKQFRRPAMVAAGAAVAVAVIAAGAWWQLGRMPEPVQVAEPDGGAPPADPALAALARPVIAVLPFANLSADAEQEYFADGITEEIITALSRFQDIAVIGRNTTFQFKDRAVDIRALAKELGAHFVLEGSVRRTSESVRVTAQLVGGGDGAHLWADSFDGPLSAETVFETQDSIARQVAVQVGDTFGAINLSRMAEATARPTASLRGYECVLLWNYYMRVLTGESYAAALACLEKATAETPRDAEVLGALSEMYTEDYAAGYGHYDDGLRRGLDAARRAIEADPRNQRAHWAMANALYMSRDKSRFLEEADAAIRLNPNNGNFVGSVAANMIMAGEWERGGDLLLETMALNPHYAPWHDSVLGQYYLRRRDFDRALVAAQRFDTANPGLWFGPWLLAVIYGHMGRTEEGAEAVKRLVDLYPDITANIWAETRKWQYDETFILFLMDGLRKAGLDIPDEAATTR